MLLVCMWFDHKLYKTGFSLLLGLVSAQCFQLKAAMATPYKATWLIQMMSSPQSWVENLLCPAHSVRDGGVVKRKEKEMNIHSQRMI